jgi:hypothetical protein
MRGGTTRKLTAAIAVVSLVTLVPREARSHLAGYTKSSSGMAVKDRWPAGFPIRWNLNPRRSNNMRGDRSVAAVIEASFQTWLAAPNAALNVSRGPDSSATSNSNSPNDQNVICFVCSADFGGEETLAIAFTRVVTAPGASDGHGGVTQFAGQIIKADIFFNPEVRYGTEDGEGDADLQTVATHEIGHLFGLSHTAVVRAMMFPFAPDLLHTLSYDDVAGISVLYPKGAPDVPAGVISGAVRMANTGSPVFGAHVFANSLTNAEAFAGRNIRKSPIGTLTFPDGTYRIEGVPPDSYHVIVEPLDDPMTAENVPDYGDTFDRTVQTNFTTRWR